MKSKLILLVTALTVLCACEKESNSVNVDYSIMLKTNVTYDSLQVFFSHTRAMQHSEEGIAFRSVYIESQEINFSSENYNTKYSLGSSEIENGIIKGYDISLGNYFLFKDGKKIQIIETSSTSIELLKEINFNKNENHSICFELDLDNSINCEDEDNYTIEPKIKIIKNAP